MLPVSNIIDLAANVGAGQHLTGARPGVGRWGGGESEEIRDLAGGLRRGFGSLRVRVTIGSSTWTTSIFPDSGGKYVLPVKKPVRQAQGLDVGDVASVTVELIDLA